MADDRMGQDFFEDDQPTGETRADAGGAGTSSRSRSRSSSKGSSSKGSSGRSSSRGSSGRRGRSGGGGSGGGVRTGGGGGGSASAALRQPGVRILLGVVFLVVIVLVITLVVRDCRRNQLVDSYKSYLNTVSQVLADSSKQGDRLQDILANKKGEKPTDLQVRVKALAGEAERLVARARELDPPGNLNAANQSLITSLEYRRNGLDALAAALPVAVTSRNKNFASATLASAMQRMLASDVIYSDSFVQVASRALKDDDITGIQVPDRELFLGGKRADQAAPVGAATLLPALQRTGGTTPGGTTGSGLHGMGLISVEALPEAKPLTQGETTTLQASEQLQWKVTVKNQGDFQENGVVVRATFASAGNPDQSQPVEAEIPTIGPGEEASVTLPGPRSPTFGEESSLKVEVVPVPEEQRTENNRGEFPVKIVF